MYIPHFAYSFICWWIFGFFRFQLLWIMLRIWVYKYLFMSSVLLDMYPEVEVLELYYLHMVGNAMCKFLRIHSTVFKDFPGGPSGKELACQWRRQKRLGFDSWGGKIPWRRAGQPTPVFLPGESHGQMSLVGYSPWGYRVGHDWRDLAAAYNFLQWLYHSHQQCTRVPVSPHLHQCLLFSLRVGVCFLKIIVILMSVKCHLI